MIRLHLSAKKSLLRIYFENPTNETQSFRLVANWNTIYLRHLLLFVNGEQTSSFQRAIVNPRRQVEEVSLQPGHYRMLKIEIEIGTEVVRLGLAEYRVGLKSTVTVQFQYFGILSNVVALR